VQDFLFVYYPFSFGKLEKWHPPFGTALEASAEMDSQLLKAPYQMEEGRVFSDPEKLSVRARARLVWIRELLNQTRSRPPVFSCHGLHEWAMVYQGCAIRHETSTPLRLSQSEIDEVVSSRPLACTHFDAFRFFHPEAQKMNRTQPSLDARPDLEQPGCVHANMDLYKWAAKAMPWVGSDLLIDCFELALRLRELDMRASPYNLSEFDLKAVAIETAEGRREYETIQRQLSEEAGPLRDKLILILDQVISVTSQGNGSDDLAAIQ
jgi:hypothetical protein